MDATVGAYTHTEVAALFRRSRWWVYRQPWLMACRIPRTSLFSRTKIDAMLNGDLPKKRAA